MEFDGSTTHHSRFWARITDELESERVFFFDAPDVEQASKAITAYVKKHIDADYGDVTAYPLHQGEAIPPGMFHVQETGWYTF